jgi:tetratricopeptide (TPR) repeat protein
MGCRPSTIVEGRLKVKIDERIGPMKKYLNYFLCTAFAAAVTIAHPALGGIPLTPDPVWQATADQATQLDREGLAALDAGDPVAAEDRFRQASATFAQTNFPWPFYEYDLAEALVAQGKNQEAMQVYQHSLQTSYPVGRDLGVPVTNALLRYSLLLNQSGHWAEAVARFDAAIPALPGGGDMPSISVSLNPDVSQPTVLAAATHVALGLETSWSGDYRGVIDNQKAQSEFAKALELAPDWDVANYYYAYGLRHLGQTQQANAAFEKTVKIAKGAVKTAAELALKNQKKPV